MILFELYSYSRLSRYNQLFIRTQLAYAFRVQRTMITSLRRICSQKCS